jgi:hypothetical protein
MLEKPRRRRKDSGASRRKLDADPWCRAHLRYGQHVRATNTHHLLGKGQSGDDDPANLIPLCGSGSTGCHGALHGTPYTDASGRRWEARDVRAAIGLGIRPGEYVALVRRIREAPAQERLRRFYLVDAELGSTGILTLKEIDAPD